MKIKTVFKFLALTVVAVLYSCSSDDDNGIVTDENVVKSDAEANALVNGAYSPLQTLSSSFSFLVEIATEAGISFEGEENEAGPEVSRLEVQPTNWYAVKVYNRLYKVIGLANDAIEKISASDAVSESAKEQTIGKAKLLRGLSYSYLVELYGEVPLVLQTGTTVTTRSSIDEVYTQIVKDLSEAADLLPEYDSNPVNPSKGSANALLARAYLAWGYVPLSQSELETIASSKQDPEFRINRDRLSKAVAYSDSVINSGRYELLSDYTKIFGRTNESKAPEHIFTIRHDGDAVDAQGNHQTHCAFTFAFDIEKDNHLSPADIDLYNNWDSADSIRRDFSYTTYIVNPEEKYDELTTVPSYVVKDKSGYAGYYFLPPVTLPRWGKGVDRSYENSVNHAITTNEVDRIEIRYAEVLLIKAEALVELGRADEALPLINKIRERAYGNSEHNLTVATREAVRDEWKKEFVYEQKYWFNLVRWKKLISSVQTVKDFEHFDDSYAVAGETGRDGYTVNAFFAKVYKHLHAKYNNICAKHYRFPIPTGEKGEDLGVTPQNPGY